MTLAVSGISFPAFALGMVLMQVFLGATRLAAHGRRRHVAALHPAVADARRRASPRSWRASRARRSSTSSAKTTSAPRAPKGLDERRVVIKHGMRNALIPVVTMMGLQFGFLLGGSIVVEKVFNWPGLGRLLIDAVDMRDYPVIQALVLLFSLEFILINLIVDVLYGVINPTIRYR